ncbi:MAG: hypothetical protein AAFR49_18130 [Pseudomonadota bacterium]
MPQMPQMPGQDDRRDLEWATFEYQVFKDQREYEEKQGIGLLILFFIAAWFFAALGKFIGENFIAILAAIISAEIIAIAALTFRDRNALKTMLNAGIATFVFLCFCGLIFSSVFLIAGFGTISLTAVKVLMVTNFATSLGMAIVSVGSNHALIEDLNRTLGGAMQAFDPHPMAGKDAGYFRRSNFETRPDNGPTISINPTEEPPFSAQRPGDFGAGGMPGKGPGQTPPRFTSPEEPEADWPINSPPSNPNSSARGDRRREPRVDFGTKPRAAAPDRGISILDPNAPTNRVAYPVLRADRHDLMRSEAAIAREAACWTRLLTSNPSTAQSWDEAAEAYQALVSEIGRDFAEDVLEHIERHIPTSPIVIAVVSMIRMLQVGNAPREKRYLVKRIQDARKRSGRT